MNARWFVGLTAIVMFVGCSKQGSESTVEEQPETSKSTQTEPMDRLFGDLQMADEDAPVKVGSDEDKVQTLSRSVQLRDVAKELGVNFTYRTGQQADLWMPESMGGGVGVADFDLNGLPDMVFSQGGAGRPGNLPEEPGVILFRNRSGANFVRSDEAFVDPRSEYGQGVAIGDFNADGIEDVYLTTTGKDRLFQNEGDGTFRDVTHQVFPSPNDRWSTSAQWADLNRDGLLDLYVCNYLQYDMIGAPVCRDGDGEARLCRPQEFAAWDNRAFIQQGDGRLLDEASQRGLVGEDGKSLGVAIADLNQDGHLDVYVANDTTANFYFRGSESGVSVEEAVLRGCGTNLQGQFEAGMGVAMVDVDRDGWLDVFCTNYFNESNTLYRNLGLAGFQDATSKFGLRTPSLSVLGFGAVFADLNHDGMDELVVTNGHVDNHPRNQLQKMPPQCFAMVGSQFREMSETSGAFFETAKIGRGMAKCDFDQDGDLDLVVVHQNSPVALLENQSGLVAERPNDSGWLQLNLVGVQSPRQGQGAKVSVTQGDQVWYQELSGGGTYLSTDEKRLHFGFPENFPVQMEVQWPSGSLQRLSNVELGQVLFVVEGT